MGSRGIALIAWVILVLSFVALPWVTYQGEHIPSGKRVTVSATGFEIYRAVSELSKAAALLGSKMGENVYTLYPFVLVILLIAIIARWGWLVTIVSLAGLYMLYKMYRTIDVIVSLIMGLGLSVPKEVKVGIGLYVSAIVLIFLAAYGPKLSEE